MKQTLEEIWEAGFLVEKEQSNPTINSFYNQKSIHATSKVLRKFLIEVWMLIPLSLVLFLLNLLLDNDNSFFWGIFSVIPMLAMFYIGLKQHASLKNISYGSNCYDYLITVKKELNRIALFYKKLTIIVPPAMLFPLLIYTYFNNQDKSLGEILGIASFEWPNETIFLILPLIVLLSFILAEAGFSRDKTREKKLDLLIEEIEELQGASE